MLSGITCEEKERGRTPPAQGRKEGAGAACVTTKRPGELTPAEGEELAWRLAKRLGQIRRAQDRREKPLKGVDFSFKSTTLAPG